MDTSSDTGLYNGINTAPLVVLHLGNYNIMYVWDFVLSDVIFCLLVCNYYLPIVNTL